MPVLCEPYLLDPGPSSVHVLWHTDRPGDRHVVLVGPAVPAMSREQALAAATAPGDSGPGWRRFTARTSELTRTREDEGWPSAPAGGGRPVRRPVHRQWATVTDLPPGRSDYRVVSLTGSALEGQTPDGASNGPGEAVGAAYRLGPATPAGQPVRLLLTSDHQLKPMVPANLEMVARTVGVELDGVLMAGDMVNVPDRASDWFDCASGRAFFAALTGRADHRLAGRRYRGAPILQHTPLFPALGNHEVMGRWSAADPLDSQFNDPAPDDWDTTTYAEMFPVPASPEGGSRWWSRTIGDTFVASLFVTLCWRPTQPPRGRYAEAEHDLADPARWGHGQIIYEPVRRGSAQYEWLARELAGPAARAARYRVVMFHHPAHGLGDHSVPPYTDPVPVVTRDPATGAITAVRYDYPARRDQILHDLEPLLNDAGVHLVLNGHSHVWNRFRGPTGVNWLETSNVGNTYGAYHVTSGRRRSTPPEYARQGDPGGLDPVTPTVAALTDPDGRPLPYLASNDITAFSILDSARGVVSSYRYDTRSPDSPVLLFDEFPLA